MYTQTISNRRCAHKPRQAFKGSAAVYDGRQYLGVILPNDKDGFRAIDCDERLVGDFASQREAATAIMRGVR